MKADLLTGTFVLLLLAVPAPAYGLGLVEYGPAAVHADQPVLSLSRLNGILAYVSSWQPGLAVGCCETAPFRFGMSLLLLAGTLLAGYWPGRWGLRKHLVKLRRALQHLKPGTHGPGLLSTQ